MRRFVTLLSAPVLVMGLVAGCGGSSSGGDDSLPAVSGKYGDKPKVTVDKKVKPKTTLEKKVIEEGSGPTVKKGDLLVADYLGEVYKTGKVFDNSYDRKVPAAFPIGVGQVVKGWDQALVGVKAGSRVLMVLPPKLGYGKQGNPQAGIKGTDSLVFVVDVIASYASKKIDGEAPTPVPNLSPKLPQVTGDWGTEPKITVGKDAVPPTKDPEVTVVATGKGEPLEKGKLLVLQFTAVKWTGEALSSTWTTSGARGVPVGAAGEQPGTNPFSLLIGKPIGSRVLLTLPAQSGSDPKKETLAVVVDLIAQKGTAKEESTS